MTNIKVGYIIKEDLFNAKKENFFTRRGAYLGTNWRAVAEGKASIEDKFMVAETPKGMQVVKLGEINGKQFPFTIGRSKLSPEKSNLLKSYVQVENAKGELYKQAYQVRKAIDSGKGVPLHKAVEDGVRYNLVNKVVRDVSFVGTRCNKGDDTFRISLLASAILGKEEIPEVLRNTFVDNQRLQAAIKNWEPKFKSLGLELEPVELSPNSENIITPVVKGKYTMVHLCLIFKAYKGKAIPQLTPAITEAVKGFVSDISIRSLG